MIRIVRTRTLEFECSFLVAPPDPLCLRGERPLIAAAQPYLDPNLMPGAYTIDSVWLGFLTVLGGLLLCVAGSVARAFWKRMDRDQERQDARMDRDKAEVLDLIKQSDKRSEGRDHQIEAKVHDLTYHVGRLDGSGGVRDGLSDRSRQRSPQQDNAPLSASDREPGSGRVAERPDRPMVPLAGVRLEPARPAGLARQAVPGQQQTGQQGGETEAEPHAEESPDTAR